jgi:TRAP-type transport system small permease protein
MSGPYSFFDRNPKVVKHPTVRLLEKVYSSILIGLTITMFIVVTFNVFMRFVMNNSVGWADELARFVFIWLSMIGAALAFAYEEHVGLSYFVERVKSDQKRKVLVIVKDVLVIVVLAFLTYYGFRAAVSAQNTSPALNIPMSIVYGILPFNAFLMLAIGFVRLIGVITSAPEDTRIDGTPTGSWQG